MMGFLLTLVIFVSSTFANELRKETYSLNTTQNVTDLRAFFKSSEIKLTADCANNENITIFYSVIPYPCFLADFNALNHTFKELSKKTHALNIYCNNIVEEVVIPNSSFPQDGIYFYRLTLFKSPNRVTFSVNHPFYGHLGPMEWPLLPFYSVMCVVYGLYALVWLLLCCCHYRDLLRVQFWIGAVILMGMLEKAMFAGEYDTVRKHGTPTRGLLVAAQVVSSVKKTTSRMLIIIVSLGFGFIKPRLGTAMHKVTLVGGIFFVLSVCDALGRTYIDLQFKPNLTISKLLDLVLSMTDSFIILWIFMSLVKTIRTLEMRKKVLKLALYRHFRNVLFFFVLVSVVYLVWSNYQFKWTACISDWQDLWWDTAFWHLEFSLVLLAIIVLWRPSANNQRYAYSPLHDDEDDDDDVTVHEASGVARLKKGKKSTEDEDLQWVDENIPSSKITNVLSNIIDSEDELNQKIEISKML